MNGLRNLAFLVMIALLLVATTYEFSIANPLVNETYNVVNATFPNIYTDAAHAMWLSGRDAVYLGIIDIMVPFLVLICLANTLINRNQSMTGYLVQALALTLLTPIAIYIGSEIISNMLNVTILDLNYAYTTFLSNFMYILIANLVCALLSFVFTRQEGTISL